MHKRISKILSCSLFVLTIVYTWSIDAFAATVFDPWGDKPESWYSYGFNPAYYPLEIYCRDGSSVSIKTLPVDSEGSITRTIDGVTYSTSTSVYKSSVAISEPHTFQFTDISSWGWSDGIVDLDDPPIYTFTDLDLYYLVNIYGAGAVLYTGDDLYLSASYSLVSLAYETGVGQFVLSLDCEVVASTKYSAASTTYIVHVSYHSDVEYMFELDDYDVSMLTLMIGSSGSAPMCTTLTDVDFGIIDGRIGTRQYNYIDPWGNLPRPPIVHYDFPLEEKNVIAVYDIINSSQIVTLIFVPICLLSLTYFTLRSIIWKG